MNFNLTLFAQAAAFLLFIWFTAKLVWPILLEKVEARQKMIADGLAEAEQGRSSLAEAHKQTEVMLREARARAHELVAQAEQAANQRVEESKSQAKGEGDRLLAAARAQIEQEVQAAREKLREQVAALAVSGAEKILRREVDAKAHAEMLERLKAQI
ncbi:MAG TPA: F0F1 ATP synthase subunit B [Usitatibacter sp.]|nr:F0F1 ATP synthase subunit B [Usitatibacter sp.]